MPRLLRFASIALVASFVSVAALACDPLPDECQLDDNVCENNVANACFRPGPESRLKTLRTDCGPTRTCVLQKDSESGVAPVCAQKDAPACPQAEQRACNGDVVSTCVALADGRLTWVDAPTCAKGCKVDPTYGAECIY